MNIRIWSFTLIEVTITIVVMGILIGALFQAYGFIARIATTIQANNQIQQEMLYILQTLQNDVDTAQSVYALQENNQQSIIFNKDLPDQRSYELQCADVCTLVRTINNQTTLLNNTNILTITSLAFDIIQDKNIYWFRFSIKVQHSKNKWLEQALYTFFSL
jgi:type II secretory pathway component PulJ